MKLDLIRTIVAIGIAMLVAWGYYAMTAEAASQWPVAIVTGMEMALVGMGLMGLSYPRCPRSGTMIRTLCGLAAVLLLILNGVYAYCGVNTSFYVLNGIAALIVLLAANSLYKADQ